MKYIRTKDGIYENEKCRIITNVAGEKMLYANGQLFNNFSIIKQSDTIEELCDKWVFDNEFGERNVIKNIDYKFTLIIMKRLFPKHVFNVKLAIFTDKGLIYVAKMNEKGELELL